MIKNIIFDLGGVLLNLDINRCFDGFAELGMDVDKMVNSADKNDHKGATMCDGVVATGIMDDYQVGKISTSDFFTKTLAECKPGTTLEQVQNAWNSWILDIPQYKLDLILSLRSKGYKTYMLSNTNDSHWKHIEKNNFPLPVNHYFDDIFLSQELGLAKPGDEIYLEVLRRIGCNAEDCLFIDDSQANCDAAERLGIKAIKYEIGTELTLNLD